MARRRSPLSRVTVNACDVAPPLVSLAPVRAAGMARIAVYWTLGMQRAAIMRRIPAYAMRVYLLREQLALMPPKEE